MGRLLGPVLAAAFLAQGSACRTPVATEPIDTASMSDTADTDDIVEPPDPPKVRAHEKTTSQ